MQICLFAYLHCWRFQIIHSKHWILHFCPYMLMNLFPPSNSICESKKYWEIYIPSHIKNILFILDLNRTEQYVWTSFYVTCYFGMYITIKITEVKNTHYIQDGALCGNSQRVKAVSYCYKKGHLSCTWDPPLR